MNSARPRYAGFWLRLSANLLDALIMLPVIAVVSWAGFHHRLFDLYYLVPGTCLGLFYSVYLVRRYGGTPGKLIAGLRILKVDGTPVGYREALWRFAPELVLSLLMSVAMVIPTLQMSDLEFQSLGWMARTQRIMQMAPPWLKPVQIIQNIWVWGELIVLLTNKEKRALHDFIAGTIVVRHSRVIPPLPAPVAAAPDWPWPEA